MHPYADHAIAPEVAEQTAPVGGGDHDGDMPRVAIPAAVVGTTTVREQPTLEAAPGVLVITAGDTQRLIGRSATRRRLHISSDKAITVAVNRQQAASGFGFRVPANIIWSPAFAGELWVFAPSGGGDASVTYWSELDAG